MCKLSHRPCQHPAQLLLYSDCPRCYRLSIVGALLVVTIIKADEAAVAVAVAVAAAASLLATVSVPISLCLWRYLSFQ